MLDLYRQVYTGEYADESIMSEGGMRSYLNYHESRTITKVFAYKSEIIGAVSIAMKYRVGYIRGALVSPKWQGRVRAREMFQHILCGWLDEYEYQLDYIYGECRTKTPKMANIIGETEWHPCGFFPNKDIFNGKRETEVLYVSYTECPEVKDLALTPRAARIASAFLGFPVQPRSRKCIVPSLVPSGNQASASRVGDTITISSGNGKLTATVNPTSGTAECVEVEYEIEDDQPLLLGAFVEYLRQHFFRYAEIYIPASDWVGQNVLEDLGFSPTGFIPEWYAPGAPAARTCLLYTLQFPSHEPIRKPKFTKLCQEIWEKIQVPLPEIPRLTFLEHGTTAIV